jgi:hypothetical protein
MKSGTGAGGYNWATLSPGDKYRDLVPKVGVGRKADDDFVL